jgi:argininosuccinate lyase
VDIRGSLAHARMLAAVGVLPAGDLAAIEGGMETIRAEIERGDFPWSRELEDVHFNIERRLTSLCRGPRQEAAHRDARATTRSPPICGFGCASRSMRSSTGIEALRRAFIGLAESHAATIMPGYTHLQVAQPVTFGHHLLAYEAMFRARRRAIPRLPAARQQAAVGERGAGGHELPDRSRPCRSGARVRSALAPIRSMPCPIAISPVEFTAAAAVDDDPRVRFAEELAWWTNPRFAFVALADRFCTGSSIMPQKKNPDVAELARGKTGRVTGTSRRAAHDAEGPAARL